MSTAPQHDPRGRVVTVSEVTGADLGSWAVARRGTGFATVEGYVVRVQHSLTERSTVTLAKQPGRPPSTSVTDDPNAGWLLLVRDDVPRWEPPPPPQDDAAARFARRVGSRFD